MATKYQAQWYKSTASKKGPYAVTKSEKLWQGSGTQTYDDALAQAKEWMTGGNYKTSRVVELNSSGEPVSVHWMSVWEKPDDFQSETGDTFVPAAQAGKSVKLHVWMPTSEGPPDHWLTLWQWMQRLCGDANNWDLVYGREVDSRARKTLWSIRLNLWAASGLETLDDWDWYTIFGKDHDVADDVEFIRATDIGPREIPSGVEKATCTNCAKVYPETSGWIGGEDEEPFCSCLCIDIYMGSDAWRMDPDGEQTSDPGCVVQAHATV